MGLFQRSTVMPEPLLALLLALSIPSVLWAQTAPKLEKELQPKEMSAADLAKAAQNPVANMNSIPVQFNWTTGGGLGDATQSVINVQPVLPLPINKEWILVARTVVPMVNLPLPGGQRSTGIGDIQGQFYFVPAESGKLIWGLGPIFSFPTATNSVLETGQFALGPTGVALAMPGPWVVGGIANNLWRVGGSDSTSAINALFLQPFINYNFGVSGWSLVTSPAITANWSAASGQEWTVPIGLGVSKITTVGKQSMSVSINYYHNAVRPDAAGADVIRMQFVLLYPKGR